MRKLEPWSWWDFMFLDVETKHSVWRIRPILVVLLVLLPLAMLIFQL